MLVYKSVRLMILAAAAMAAAGCFTAMNDLRQINEEQTRRIAELEKNHEEYTNSYYNLKKEKEKLEAQYGQEMEAKTQEIARLKRLHSEQLSEAEKTKVEIASKYKQQLEQSASSELSLKQGVADLEKNKKDTQAELAETNKTRDALGAQLKTTQTDLEKTKSDLDKATAKVADLEQKSAKLQEELGAAREAATADRKKTAELEEKAAQWATLQDPKKDMAKLYDTALEDLKGEIADGNATVSRDKRGVAVRVPATQLFESASVPIVRAAARKTLAAIATLAAKFPGYSIAIEGHTDSEKVVRASFADNLELSMQRALNVYRKMVEEIEPKIPPERMRAVGCGEFHPIADNATPEGKRKNRRVEFVLTPLY